MSSYNTEYHLGYIAGIEEGREIANRMYQDGLKSIREFEDESSTVFYNLKKIFEYLKINECFSDEKQFNKLVTKYKTYLLEEKESMKGTA